MQSVPEAAALMPLAEAALGPTFRINDATVLSIPGSEGIDWRLHAVYDPAQGCLRRVEITDQRGGERSVAQDFAPHLDAQIATDDRRAFAVAGIYQVKEQIGVLGFGGNGSDVVKDQEIGSSEATDEPVGGPIGQ